MPAEAVIAGQVADWLGEPCAVTPISVSENRNFHVSAAGGRYVLRVHRPGYQSEAAIASELAWLAALRPVEGLHVPCPVALADGRGLRRLRLDGVRHPAVLFRFEPGGEPDPTADLSALFGRLGAMAARLHRHAQGWRRPAGFTRPVLDDHALLDPAGAWGDWRASLAGDKAAIGVIARATARLGAALADYGRTADRFGLIHADMRLGNLLVEGARITLIDFDDCGFGWFGYDFAAAISFHECHPDAPEWRARWLEAYRALRPFGAEDEAMLDGLVLLRRLALLAWISSHADTALAARHRSGFAEGTLAMAERWLAGS